MIESFAERLAVSIKKANKEDTASIAVMKFAIIGLFNNTVTLLLILLVGLLTGKFIETVIAICFFVVLRFVSGGYHLKSPISCIIVSTITIAIIPHIPISDTISMTLTCISLLLVLIFSPSNIRGATRIPEKYFPLLKVISVVFVATNFLLQFHIVSIAFFFQSLSLISLRR